MAYVRKTYDEWRIESNCGYGWDLECIEGSRADAVAQLKCYRENVSYPVRIRKVRVSIA